MKKFLWVIFLAAILGISGCALPKQQEITVDDNIYSDPNRPSVNVKFPFDIYLYSESSLNDSSSDATVIHSIAELRTDHSDKCVYIDKARISQSNGYFTGVNYEKEKLFYKDKRKDNNGCYVYYKKIKNMSILFGDVIKYTLDNGLINIRIAYFLKDVYGYNDVLINHKDTIDKIKSDVIYICEQMLDNKN